MFALRALTSGIWDIKKPVESPIAPTHTQPERLQAEKERIYALAQKMGFENPAEQIAVVIDRETYFNNASASGGSLCGRVRLSPSFLLQGDCSDEDIQLSVDNKKWLSTLTAPQKAQVILSREEKDFIYAHELSHLHKNHNLLQSVVDTISRCILTAPVYAIGLNAAIHYVKRRSIASTTALCIGVTVFPLIDLVWAKVESFDKQNAPNFVSAAFSRLTEELADREAAELTSAAAGIRGFKKDALVEKWGGAKFAASTSASPIAKKLCPLHWNRTSHPTHRERIAYLEGMKKGKCD